MSTMDLTPALIELIRRTSTDLPGDVEKALEEARLMEEAGSAARKAFDAMLENAALARRNGTPICQDTGTPIFHVRYPEGWNPIMLKKQIRDAVAKATELFYLRPNAVHPLTGKNSGNNLGDDAFPAVHLELTEAVVLTADLLLKGGGSENVGAQYSLPDSTIGAGRDLDGVRRAVLDAVWKAQGRGCAPGIIGVAIGGDRGSSYHASKLALLRRLDDTNNDEALAALEKRLLSEINGLGIGPMGFGGRTTALGVKIAPVWRHTASFFVTVSYGCWAHRRRRMIVDGNGVKYE